jgi:hypothetical protein
MSSSLEHTLNQRGAQYGPLREQWTLAQAIKATMRSTGRFHLLQPYEAEALDMLATKISRAISGLPRQRDTWHDIAGYATLVEQALGEDEEADGLE